MLPFVPPLHFRLFGEDPTCDTTHDVTRKQQSLSQPIHLILYAHLHGGIIYIWTQLFTLLSNAPMRPDAPQADNASSHGALVLVGA